jgi:23S rRNA (uridine2552-2'-O)-methyltransferase
MPRESTHLKVGDVIAEKYRIERPLGEGGMGVVFLARHLELDARVALKFLQTEAAQSADAVGRFLREARAAFKLIELDDKFHLITKGCKVVDLGAAPGGWSQVAVARGAGRVVGVDLLPVDPVAGAEIILGDFNDPELPGRLAEMMGGKADLVLSDMAPNTTGHGPTDHLRIMGLAEIALDFAERVLKPGGGFVAKVFQGGSEAAMLVRLRQRFSAVKHAKPAASRKDSSELYVVATGFKG